MSKPFDSSSRIEPLSAACLGDFENIFIQRDDLIHPIVSGNKWRKLKFILKKATEEGKTHLVTFGGAYSNHMLATACAGAVFGFRTSCFIRGDELKPESNHYLYAASLYGMELISVDRESFRGKTKIREDFILSNPQAYFIPEGGACDEGYLGVEEIISELTFVPDIILHASATGTTSIGLAKGLISAGKKFESIKIFSIPVLKNWEAQLESFDKNDVANRITICDGFEHGGYAKVTSGLMEFCRQFIRETGIMIDPVYTGKALLALKELQRLGVISEDKKVLFIHTGGTMGIFSNKFSGK